MLDDNLPDLQLLKLTSKSSYKSTSDDNMNIL